ncbi:MAG: hypothetical protein CL661_06800 [Bacteroidetes bacterium]|jgi:hypothetical protein|nr:hypothetical protein [Bacteroidota bacterium]|tara:strand:+ start:213 stop:1274 length:1062 start_codon:yes stop_codon:yes gene_type:complete
MKNKKLIILAIILAPAAIWILMQNDSSTLKESESEFAISDTSAVTKIFIADKQNNSVLLERTANGWILDGKYSTNPRVVEILLETMRRLKVKSPVPKAARDNIVKRMSSIGRKVEVYQKAHWINLFDKYKMFPYEKLSKVYYVGDVTPNNLGTYMLMEDAADPYVIHIPGFRGFLTPRFSPIPDDWKSHQVFNHNLADIISISMEFLEIPDESFRVDISDSDGSYKLIKLSDKENISRFDTLRLLNFLTSFSDLRYESRLNNLMSPITIDSIMQSDPMFEVTLVDDKKDTTYIITYMKGTLSQEVKDEIYNKLVPDDRDRFYALINNGEDFVLMQYYTFDKILYPLSYYKTTD